MTAPGDYRERFEAIVESNSFMTLATADADGLPWATPVWYAHSGRAEFLWVSDPDARHSKNVAVRSEIAIVICDPTVFPADAQAAYMEAVAVEVAGADLAERLEIYSKRSQAHALSAWTVAQVTGSAPLRLYGAKVTAQFVLHEGRHRVRVDSASRTTDDG